MEVTHKPKDAMMLLSEHLRQSRGGIIPERKRIRR